jgi:flagellar biosynthesis/type III secretory pathway M-ring protein FliF/YscJ
LNRLPPDAPEAVPAPRPAPAVGFNWRKQMPIVIGAAAAVAIAIVIAVVAFARGRKRAAKSTKTREAEISKALPSGKPAAAPMDSTAMEHQLEAKMAERAAEQERADLAALATIKVPPVKTKKAEVLAKQLRENAKKDPSSSAHILQAWIHDRA